MSVVPPSENKNKEEIKNPAAFGTRTGRSWTSVSPSSSGPQADVAWP